MGNMIGIDLGTTMSAIAKLDERGKPEIIPTGDGERIMPSVVLKDGQENKLIVGENAKLSYPDNIKNGAKLFKREMSNPDYSKEVGEKKYSAAALSSLILKKLAKDASKENGEIKDVVISVPAYFKEIERNATVEAGRLAGLNVINIINEPTAAALYYVKSNDVSGKILIYDLGGGTFDVTLLEVYGNDIKILSSEGDHRLGGVDFDNALLELFAEKYEEETDEELYTTEEDKEELLLQAERAKKKLSKSQSIKERLVGEGGRAVIEITKEEFEEKISTYIARTELLTEQVFESAKLDMDEIDDILLVGGSTRIPLVSETIEETVGKKPINAVNVDEAVALGAAIKAGLIKGTVSDVTVKDITNHSYGTISLSYDEITEKSESKNSIILKKNTPIPCSKTETFYTTHDGQLRINVEVTQGEDEDKDYVDIIEKKDFELDQPVSNNDKIDITYSYDANGIMNCLVEQVGKNNKLEIKIDIKKITKNTSGIEDFTVE